jgi:hypothetical protein
MLLLVILGLVGTPLVFPAGPLVWVCMILGVFMLVGAIGSA